MLFAVLQFWSTQWVASDDPLGFEYAPYLHILQILWTVAAL